MLARYLDTGQEYNNTKEQMGLDIDRIFIDAGTVPFAQMVGFAGFSSRSDGTVSHCCGNYIS
jgi:hypothetical protein